MTDATATNPSIPTSPALPEGWFSRDTGWVVYEAQGADAAKFLHGQLTQDVEHLDGSAARLAGYCSAKGRLLASVMLWRSADQLQLALPADQAEATIKRLSMFVLRAQCKFLPRPDLVLTAVGGLTAQTWLEERLGLHIAPLQKAEGPMGSVIGLPQRPLHPRFLIAGSTSPDLPEGLTDVGLAGWQVSGIDAGVATIYADRREAYVPQMVNFELVQGVNFSKGCYPGQEVVARSHYLGKLKRRMQLAILDAAQALPARGCEVWSAGDASQPAGSVVESATGPDGRHWLLIELPLAALSHGLSLGTLAGHWQPGP